MKKSIAVKVILVIIGIVAVVLGRGFFYYSGFYRPPPSQMPSYENIVTSPAPSAEFTDQYTPEEGAILIDLAHDNNFVAEELNVLLLRLVSRGFAIRFLSVEDDLKEALLGEKGEAEISREKPQIGETTAKEEGEAKLPNAFIIVSPQAEFSKEEKETIAEFVGNGGKLLLIADPTRDGKINSVSLEFRLIFEPDYLYNQKENETNYRNIFVSDFTENEITKELRKIVLYTAGSISSADAGITFVDENTFSSLIETRGKLSPIALTREAKVLALYDLTFMIEPYNGSLDNNRLIANIAAWLVSPTEEKTE